MADIRLSLCDMKELYSLILEECSSEMPTIIVVKQMVGVFEGLTHKFFVTKSGDKNVMLMFGESDLQTMKSNLRAYLEEFKSLDTITLEVRTEFSMPLAHRKDMYKHAILISEYLNIVCPQIIAMNPGDLGTDSGRRKTYLDESITDKDVPIGDTIFIINRGRTRQIHSIAHELRHCWQEYKSNEGFYKNYITHTGSNTVEQANQKEEIDADAYACLYVEKYLGIADGTVLMYDSEEAAKDWGNYTKKVKERMKNINI
ncbi:MAG: hypothetical protein IKL74_01990 [Clostridia bacterium]|nr:hypothetical protein [Clostridia bacterium]